MSTNFYAKHPGMSDDDEGLHIGKRSVGWEFLFEVHADLDLVSSTDWRRFLAHPWVTIISETGVPYDTGTFWSSVAVTWTQDTKLASQIIGVRRDGLYANRVYRDEQGYAFADYVFC